MKRPYRKWFTAAYLVIFLCCCTPVMAFVNVPKLVCGIPVFMIGLFGFIILANILLFINYKLDCKYDAIAIEKMKNSENAE